MPNSTPQAFIATHSTLCGEIGRYFHDYPTLHTACRDLLRQQWQARGLNEDIDPLSLSIIRPMFHPDGRPDGYDGLTLMWALVVRFCLDETLNLNEGLDILSQEYGTEHPRAVSVPLAAVEALLNDCGPQLVAHYKQLLVDYWSNPQGDESPWNWLSGYLKAQFSVAIDREYSAERIDKAQRDLALRLAQPSGQSDTLPVCHLLNFDGPRTRILHPELASALVIEPHPSEAANGVLLYCLSGNLLGFNDRQQMVDFLFNSLPYVPPSPARLSLNPVQGLPFVQQAQALLEQQLLMIDHIAEQALIDNDAWGFIRVLDPGASMLGFDSLDERQRDETLGRLLPAWLLGASADDRMTYLHWLEQLGDVLIRHEGRSVLEGVLDLPAYAAMKLDERLLEEHPDSSVASAQVVLLIHAVEGQAIGQAGTVHAAGVVHPVRLPLIRAAIEQFATLPPGRVEVQLDDHRAPPAWLTLDYLRRTVQSLDVGASYPDWLRMHLLQDPDRAWRRALFVEQLSAQLPAAAQELKLRGLSGMDDTGYRLVAALCSTSTEPGLPRRHVSLYRLGFARQSERTVDVAACAFMIEAAEGRGACLLYRPLHEQRLQQFADRDALHQAIAEPGALQDDILARLSPEASRWYAQHGFRTAPGPGYFPGAALFLPPAPGRVELRPEPVTEPPLLALYEGWGTELIRQAELHSVSAAQSRWGHYKTLAWLTFNAVLPLADGPVATAGWLAQVAQLLSDELDPVPAERSNHRYMELVQGLANVMILLLSQEVEPLALGVVDRAEQSLPKVDFQVSSSAELKTTPGGFGLARLDRQWSRPVPPRGEALLELLASFKADIPPEQWGEPIPQGALQGLYLHDNRLWVRLGPHALYPVRLEGEQPRIVDLAGTRKGPLLQRIDGVWYLDLRLRLRGGMPTGQRIAQLRAVKQARIAELVRRQAEFLPQRMQMALRMGQTIDAVDPDTQDWQTLRDAMAPHVQATRDYEQALVTSHDEYRELNQLQVQPDFRRTDLDYLGAIGRARYQMLIGLRALYQANRGQIRDFTREAGEALAAILDQRDSPERARYLAMFEKSNALIDEIAEFDHRFATNQHALGERFPDGPEVARGLDEKYAHEPSLIAWHSERVSILAILGLNQSRYALEHLVDEVVQPARIGLQLRAEARDTDAFDEAQRIEILDSALKRCTAARESLGFIRQALPTADENLWLDQLGQLLSHNELQIEDELAALIRTRPARSREQRPASRHSKVLVRTRNRGVMVGRRRQVAGAGERLEVIEPVENAVLAQFEASVEGGDWVERKPVPQMSVIEPLAPLLAEARLALSKADAVMARAAGYAQTASVPGEIEDLLLHQADGLRAHVQRIEAVLTRQNLTDASRDGLDAAALGKVLLDKAGQLAREGQRLRVGIIVRQLPTASRLDYLLKVGQASIRRVGSRKPLARKKGRSPDFLDEYEVLDGQGKPLWYAHFHYPAADSAAGDYLAAHLKTPGQRYDGVGKQHAQAQDGREVIRIYRSQIDQKLAGRIFGLAG